MKENRYNQSFWPSYVDIMTTLFAIMLVLFAVSYNRFKVKEAELRKLANKYEKQIERDVINGNYSSKVHINENYSDNKDMINVKNKFNQVLDYHKYY